MTAEAIKNNDNRTLGRVLEIYAESTPDTVFLKYENQQLTYGEANALVNQYANGLSSLGIKNGDRIAMFMDNDPGIVLVALATNKLGAIWSPVNLDYKGEWLVNGVNDIFPSLIISDLANIVKLESVADHLNCKQIILNTEVTGEAGKYHSLSEFRTLSDQCVSSNDVSACDTSAIIWTSGTTGRSKGVMLSHNMWVNAAECIEEYFGFEPGCTSYNCLPLFNCAAWATNILFSLVTGTTCAMDKTFSASNFWDRVRFYEATRTFTLGIMHIYLWNSPERPDDTDNKLTSAQMIPMPEHLLQPFMQRFGIKQISQAYGQSETLMIIQRSSGEEWPAHSLGRPVPYVQIKLLDDNGNEVPVNEPGEICVLPGKENVIFNGYFNNPEATAEAYHGDWYRTGDLARKDENGDYFFVDRKSDFIRYGGRNISSGQVEQAASQHPAVAHAAVFGIPSEYLKTEAELKLDVVLRPGKEVTPEELAEFINDNAPHYFVPRYIEFRDALPQTATQKVKKFKLREMGVGPNTWTRTDENYKIKR